MYGYPPPPMWGYPPPNPPPMSEDHYRKAMEFGMKLATREQRERDRKDFLQKKDKDERRKKARTARQTALLCIELYILGIVTAPIAGPAWNAFIAQVSK